MSSFSTPDGLGTAMKRTFTEDEKAWVQTLLNEAADYLRELMQGAWVYPKRQSTFQAWPVAGRVGLPQDFVRSVDRVERDGKPVRFTRFEDTLRLPTDDEVEVTFTYGLEEPPPLLAGLNNAIVAQQIMLVEAEIGLSVGGLSSLALDDFKIAFANAGELTGLALPEHTRKLLAQQYGRTGWVVGTQT